MKKRLMIVLLIAALGIATLPNVSAQDEMTGGFPNWSECEEDLTGQTIGFYHFGDLSGALAFITTPLVAAFTDAIDYTNTHGGLCGAMIEQEYEDTGGDLEKAQTAWDKFSAKEDAFMLGLYGSGDGELLREQAAEAEIVLFNAGASEKSIYGEDGQPGWQFTYIPLYTDQIGAFCDYVAENKEALGIEGDPMIGHLTWPNAFGKAADTPGTRAYCESVGVQVAEESQLFLPDAADLTPLINNLIDQGANIIYTNTLATGPANIAKTLTAMGIRDQILLAGPNWALDSTVMALGGEDALGIVGNLPFSWWDELENPGIQFVTNEWVTRHLATATDDAGRTAALRLHNIAYITAWSVFDTWGEALIRTMNRVGYDEMSGAAVYETMQDFEYDALTFSVKWTDTVRTGRSTRIAAIQLVEGPSGPMPGVLPLSDWLDTPDLREGGADIPAN